MSYSNCIFCQGLSHYHKLSIFLKMSNLDNLGICKRKCIRCFGLVNIHFYIECNYNHYKLYNDQGIDNKSKYLHLIHISNFTLTTIIITAKLAMFRTLITERSIKIYPIPIFALRASVTLTNLTMFRAVITIRII